MRDELKLVIMALAVFYIIVVLTHKPGSTHLVALPIGLPCLVNPREHFKLPQRTSNHSNRLVRQDLTITSAMSDRVKDYSTKGIPHPGTFTSTVKKRVNPHKYDYHIHFPAYFEWTIDTLMIVRNQRNCGACWAFAVTESLASRLAIVTSGKVRVHLSPQELVSCHFVEGSMEGCNGGLPEDAIDLIVEHGVPLDKEYPYLQSLKVVNKPVPCNESLHTTTRRIFCSELHNICDNEGIQDITLTQTRDVETPKPHKGVSQKTINKNIQRMKEEIMIYGPIVAKMTVWRDFYAYDGVNPYQHDPNLDPDTDILGAHAFCIVGWSDSYSTSEGVMQPYWICRNSWGQNWPKYPEGYNAKMPLGYFMVVMGINEGGIESDCVAGDIDLMRTWDAVPDLFDKVDDEDIWDFFDTCDENSMSCHPNHADFEDDEEADAGHVEHTGHDDDHFGEADHTHHDQTHGDIGIKI